MLFTDFGNRVQADEDTWVVLKTEDLAGPARLAGRELQGGGRAAENRRLRGGQHALGGGSVSDVFPESRAAREGLAGVRRSRRPRGQERHQRADQADREASRGAREAARLREPRALAHERHHGQGAETGRSADAARLAGRRGAREARSRRHAAAGQERRREHHDRAVGLPLLHGEGPKAALRARSERVQELLRAREHDQGVVLHGRAPVRLRVRGNQRASAGVSPGRARLSA